MSIGVDRSPLSVSPVQQLQIPTKLELSLLEKYGPSM